MNIHFYDKTKIDKNNLLFSNAELKTLLIPLFIEQILNSFMGMADTMMVSNVGSATVSAASLVDSINVLVIQVFAALATGGTIICSQYMGKKDEKQSNHAAEQVLLSVVFISLSVTILGLVFKVPLLSLLFGKIEQAVMTDSLTYFTITALSFPFIAMFQTGSAFCRVCGNSKYPMIVSAVANILNIIGNAVLIFGFDMGIKGAAIATLISRIVCVIAVYIKLHYPFEKIVIKNYFSYRPDFHMIKCILAVGIPAGIENGMFQFGKLVIQSSVSTLGTKAIAAQAMTCILETANGVAGSAIGLGLVMVVGQCIGAGRKEEAKYYIVKLTVFADIAVALSCLIIMAITKPITIISAMEPESAEMCIHMLIAITIVKPLVWSLAFVPVNGLRAAGDVKFSMITSSIIMWLCRVFIAIYLIRCKGFGPMAVWIGMFCDWTVRAIVYSIRFFSGKWLNKNVIN